MQNGMNMQNGMQNGMQNNMGMGMPMQGMNMNMMAQMAQMMQNNFVKANSKFVFDPEKLDKQYKKSLINQTITQTKAGTYKILFQWKSITFPYMSNFVPGVPTSACETEVVYDHPIDVAEKYSEKGLVYTNNNNMNPVVLHVVGKGFTGLNLESNEDARDDVILLRTTFCNTSGHNNGSHYPIQDGQCVYAKAVTVIRPPNPVSFLPYQLSYRTAMITTHALKITNLLKNDRMTANDFITTCTTIETVFQTAIAREHPVLILTQFGHGEDNNPIMDIIKIYNFCIYKYGHWFKKIIIAIPQYCPKSMFEMYQQNIINPKEIISEIDDECEADEMRNGLMAKSKQAETQLEMNSGNGDMTQMFNPQNITPAQMQQMMNMMGMNPQMMQMMNMNMNTNQ